MKRAVITGANGFIGSAVVSELLAQGYQVYALDRAGCTDNIPNDSQVKAITCELSELSELVGKIPQLQNAIFFHFAWMGSAGVERADTCLQLQNAQWTLDALRVAKQLGCIRFLSSGSIMEYETIAAAYTQGNQPGLGYIYGGGKVAAHIMCMSVAADIGIELVWPVITNAYGVGERSPRMVNTTIQKCLRGETPQFTAGTQNYDFVYIEDVARAFRLIAENGKPFHEYLIGSSSARPLKEFLKEMQMAIAPDLYFHFGDIPFTGTDLPLVKFACSNTERDTGFRAAISFAEGCQRTMKWWKEQEVEADDARV